MPLVYFGGNLSSTFDNRKGWKKRVETTTLRLNKHQATFSRWRASLKIAPPLPAPPHLTPHIISICHGCCLAATCWVRSLRKLFLSLSSRLCHLIKLPPWFVHLKTEQLQWWHPPPPTNTNENKTHKNDGSGGQTTSWVHQGHSFAAGFYSKSATAALPPVWLSYQFICESFHPASQSRVLYLTLLIIR